MKRRVCAWLFCAGVSVLAFAAEPAPTNLAFEVLRKDKPMGRHTISVHRDGPDIIADIAIDLKIKFAFVTLFEYTHRNREVWRDNRLVSIETTTYNNGERFQIAGRAEDAGFRVTNGDGVERMFAADVLPTSYWHPRTPLARALLNTQTGELAEVSITPLPASSTDATARQYVVTGDLDLNLWYADGCLEKLNFRAPGDDSLIDYRRMSAPASTRSACPAELLAPTPATAGLAATPP